MAEESGAPQMPAILMVDDDPNDRFFLQRLLRLAGVERRLIALVDGEEAIAWLRVYCDPAEPQVAPLPSVLFLDIKMPRLGGFEVLRWIRGQERLKTLPVIMLSGSDEAQDMARARELGATRYLTKFPPAKIFAEIVAAAERAR